MILYHGSDRTVAEPNLQTDAAKKELGSGFYLTPDFHRQQLPPVPVCGGSSDFWKRSQTMAGGVVSTFELDETVPLKVFRFESTTAEWLQFAAVNFKKRMLP